jgi:hypothetical protein
VRKKSTQPEKVETSAERRTREPREKEDRADVDRRLEIDVSTSSTFLSYEENNVWVAEQLGEKYVQACGRWELFQRSKSLPGFTQARASWAIAWEQYLKSHGYAETSSGRLDIRELFSRQFRHDPAGALQRYAFLVSAAAAHGDVAFFDRISNEKRRGARRTRKNPLAFHILYNWLHGFLWLMPSIWGSYYLEKIIGKSVSQENYEKTRQRLKLVGWECANKHAIVTGYVPELGEFKFRQGWTNLVPTVST